MSISSCAGQLQPLGAALQGARCSTALLPGMPGQLGHVYRAARSEVQRYGFLFSGGFCTTATSYICKSDYALQVVHFITFLLLLFYSLSQSGK